MNNTIYYLYESLRSMYPIPEDKREENVQAFALGLDLGLSLGQELKPFQEPGED